MLGIQQYFGDRKVTYGTKVILREQGSFALIGYTIE